MGGLESFAVEWTPKYARKHQNKLVQGAWIIKLELSYNLDKGSELSNLTLLFQSIRTYASQSHTRA